MSIVNDIKKNKNGKELWWDIFYNSGMKGEDLSIIGGFLKKNEKENYRNVLV